ncbi:PepSY domain-containing protein [Streptomyces sp. 142MFCol3.1]|uniref:PepSY domain-containing protein n=1 Tax=Streptomyces sp. 142MFCol3.1 TaxID=1172179 RepID=UPI00042A5817|nr:PepSY domain-containing protein [Streptomyces sp. 142MFCol3.1]
MKALKRPLTGRHRTLAAVLAATALLGGGAAATAVAVADDRHDDDTRTTAGGALASRHDDNGPTDEGRDDSGHHRVVVDGTNVDLGSAAEAAAKSVAGTVTEVELDGRAGRAVWKVEVVDAAGVERDVTVDAGDGRILGIGADRDRDDDTRARTAGADLGRAVDAALGVVDGTAVSAELDDHEGGAVGWHVDVVDSAGLEHEIGVDARTGTAVSTRADDDRYRSGGDRHRSGDDEHDSDDGNGDDHGRD